MTRRGRAQRARRRRRMLVASVIGVVAGLAVVAAGMVVVLTQASPTAPGPTASAPSPTTEVVPELTAAQSLLAQASDPAACAVSFAGPGAPTAPVLERSGTLFSHLPLPLRDDAVFAGWHATADAAAEHDSTQRVNGSKVVSCPDRELTLYAAWRPTAEAAAEKTRVPILMYHQFTDKPGGEKGPLRLNYAAVSDFEEHIRHIAEGGFYLPTWPELEAFIDGRLSLPAKSLIVTDDDADSTWLSMAVPIVERYRVLTTSFVITKWRTEASPGTYVLQRSHTDSMHEAGANGRGRMVNWTPAQIAADLEKSATVLGAKEVVAYPFGHHDERTKEGMRLAGFTLGRGVENGYVVRGTDKLSLPVIRVDYGMSVRDLALRIG